MNTNPIYSITVREFSNGCTMDKEFVGHEKDIDVSWSDDFERWTVDIDGDEWLLTDDIGEGEFVEACAEAVRVFYTEWCPREVQWLLDADNVA